MWKIFSVPCGSALYKFHCIKKNAETVIDTSKEVTTEQLFGRKSSSSGLESIEYGSRDPSR
jgi:hypothetical protein